MRGPRRPAVTVRRTILAKVIRIISGQIWRRTVVSFGSGSDLSFGLKIRYDLEKFRGKWCYEVTLMLPMKAKVRRYKGRQFGSC